MERFIWRKRNQKSYPIARSSANPLPFEEKVSVPAQWNDWRFTGKYLILKRSLYRCFRCLKNHKLMLPIVPHRHPSPDRQRTSSLHDTFPPKKTKPWKINLKFVALCRPPRGCFVLLLFGSLFLILHISPDKPVSSTLYRRVLESQRMGIYIFVFLLAPSWSSFHWIHILRWDIRHSGKVFTCTVRERGGQADAPIFAQYPLVLPLEMFFFVESSLVSDQNVSSRDVSRL